MSVLQLIALLLPVVAIFVQALVRVVISERATLATNLRRGIFAAFFVGALSFYGAASKAISVVGQSNANGEVLDSIAFVDAGLSFMVVMVLLFVIGTLEVDDSIYEVKRGVEDLFAPLRRSAPEDDQGTNTGDVQLPARELK